MNSSLKIFKKIKQPDKIKLIREYYKSKSFRLLLKNTGLNDFGTILLSVGSIGNEIPKGYCKF